MASADWVYVVIRALSFIAMLQAAGLALFTRYFGRWLQASEAPIHRLCAASALAGLGLVAVQHALEAARMTGDLGGVWDSDMQRRVLESTTGLATAVRLGGLGLILAGTARPSLVPPWTTVTGSLLVTVSFAVTGHTSAHADRWLLAPMLVGHVTIAAWWFGSLPALYFTCRQESGRRLADLLAAFSARAIWAIPMIAGAGLWIAFVLIPDLAALRSTYAALLLAKIVLFALLMGIAALNKWRLAPRVLTDPIAAMAALRRSLVVEYVMIGAVLVITATLTSQFSPEP